MSDSSIARRYARGLIRSIDVNKDGAQILAALDQASALFDIDEARKLLRNPAVNVAIKRDVLLFATDKAGTKPELKIFMEQLAEARRVPLLPAVAEQFRKLLNDLQGAATAVVTSATQLSETEKAQLKAELEQLFKKKIVLENRTNPNLIGGLYISVGNFIVDLSVKSKIQSLLHAVSAS